MLLYVDRSITSETGNLLVCYKNALLYDKKFDLCLEIAELDPPSSCPIKKGTIFQSCNDAIELPTMKIEI